MCGRRGARACVLCERCVTIRFCGSDDSVPKKRVSRGGRIACHVGLKASVGRLTGRNSKRATRGTLVHTRFRPSQPHLQRKKATTRRRAVFTSVTFNAQRTLGPPADQRTACRRARPPPLTQLRDSSCMLRRRPARNTRALQKALPELVRYTTTRYPRRRAQHSPERGPYYAAMEAAASGHLHIYISTFVGAEGDDR